MNIEMGSTFLAALRRFFFRAWRPGLLVLSLAAVAYLLYFRRLAILLPGYGAPELASLHQSADWHTILNNPVNAPYTVLVWLLTAILHHGLLMTRAVSALYGILAVIAFYAVARNWYSFRIATLGTLLFATSAGFLHIARFGTPQVLQMGVLGLIAGVLWYRRAPRLRKQIAYGLVVLCALLWYVPGMVWFEVLGAILFWRLLAGQLRRAGLHATNWGTLFLVLVAPLLWAGVRQPHLLLQAAGLPDSITSLSSVANNFAHTTLSIGIRSNGSPLLWLNHVALLNATERIMAAVGLYYYLYRQRSLRGGFLVGAAAVGLALISFGNGVGFAVLVPLLYLVIAHGLSHFLHRWFVVFPRNPLARYTGVAVVCIMLFFSILFQVRAYFVAWPHNPATRTAFYIPQP